MAKAKSYRLLCPIARALDRIGDRWSLLILRDLHAGPARFTDLHTGLAGVATNLLATRLEQLQRDGLVVRRKLAKGADYVLTEEGALTAPILFDLASFGARSPAPIEPRRPGNLRLIAITLKEALRRSLPDGAAFDVEMLVDGEAFAINSAGGVPTVLYQAAPSASLSFATDYEALVSVGDGDMTPAEFGRDHVELVRGDKDAMGDFLQILGAAFGRS